MNAFNSAYYSFSPQVADYEREQPWLQASVKTILYPLFGILNLAEWAHNATSGGEMGAIAAGLVASSMMGAIYLWPAALSVRLQNKFSFMVKILLLLLSAAFALTVVGIVAGSAQLLIVSTSILVLSGASTSAMVCGRLARTIIVSITTRR
jgi:peptide/nickel transport system substrate-binding protein